MSRAVSVSLVVGRPSRLRKTAREFSSRGLPLAVIAREREKVDARPRGASCDGAENDGLAVLHGNAAGRLFGEYAGFD